MPWIDPDEDLMTGQPCPDCVGSGFPPGKVLSFNTYVDCDLCEGTGVDLTAEDGLEDYEPLAHLHETWDEEITPLPQTEKPETD